MKVPYIACVLYAIEERKKGEKNDREYNRAEAEKKKFRKEKTHQVNIFF